MNKLIVTSFLALLGITTVCAETNTVDREARKARFRERRARIYRATGGRIVKPGSQQGKIRFVSAIKDVDASVLSKQYASFKRAYPFDIDTIAGESVTVETASAAKAKLGLALGIFIVDAPFSAPMLTAPEEGWAIVNHRVCETPERTAKQAIKAFAIIAGAANSSYGVTFLSSTRPQELDSISAIEFPLDVSECIRKQLAIVNVTTEVRATYHQACEEGWAPAPTNDVQKAIWDKVHQLPTKPIKILPETKPVKE